MTHSSSQTIEEKPQANLAVMHSRYSIVVAAVVTGSFVLIALFNYFIDPYQIFGSPRIKGINYVKANLAHHVRVHKSVMAIDGDYDSFVFGTSTTEYGYDPSHPYFSGMRAFNLGLPLANVYEMYRYLDHVVANAEVKRVVFALDLFSFNAYLRPGQSPPGFVDELLAPSNSNWIRRKVAPKLAKYWIGLLTYDALAISARDLIYNLKTSEYDSGTSEYRQNGQRDPIQSGKMIERAGTYGKLFDDILAVTYKSYFPMPHAKFCMTTQTLIGPRPMEIFDSMLKLARDHDVEVVVVLSPVHAFELEAIYQFRLDSHWELWKRELTNAIHRSNQESSSKKKSRIFDFQVFSEFNTETVPEKNATGSRMEYYWESRHFKSQLGDKVLSALREGKSLTHAEGTSFGAELSVESIEGHLQRERQRHSSWRLKKPDQFLRVKNILDSTRQNNLRSCEINSKQ